MANNIVHFDLAADDVERARRFYESVFGWRFEPFGPPDFYMIFTGSDEDPGIHGSVSKRQGPLLGGGRSGCRPPLLSLPPPEARAFFSRA